MPAVEVHTAARKKQERQSPKDFTGLEYQINQFVGQYAPTISIHIIVGLTKI